MAKIFTDVAKEAAYGNSVKVQRYHGGMSNTLTAEIKLSDLGTANNELYICPIPWYARLKDISIIFDTTGKYATSNPKIDISIRNMNEKIARTASDFNDLDYKKILATSNDVSSAIGSKTLTGATLTAGSEILSQKVSIL